MTKPKEGKFRVTHPLKAWVVRNRKIYKGLIFNTGDFLLVSRYGSNGWTCFREQEKGKEFIFKLKKDAQLHLTPGKIKKVYYLAHNAIVFDYFKYPDGSYYSPDGEFINYLDNRQVFSTKLAAIKQGIKNMEQQIKFETRKTSNKLIKVRELKEEYGIK
jgi:hypothetical protein